MFWSETRSSPQASLSSSSPAPWWAPCHPHDSRWWSEHQWTGPGYDCPRSPCPGTPWCPGDFGRTISGPDEWRVLLSTQSGSKLISFMLIRCRGSFCPEEDEWGFLTGITGPEVQKLLHGRGQGELAEAFHVLGCPCQWHILQRVWTEHMAAMAAAAMAWARAPAPTGSAHP